MIETALIAGFSRMRDKHPLAAFLCVAAIIMVAYGGYEAVADYETVSDVMLCTALRGEPMTEQETRAQLTSIRRFWGNSPGDSRETLRSLYCH